MRGVLDVYLSLQIEQPQEQYQSPPSLSVIVLSTVTREVAVDVTVDSSGGYVSVLVIERVEVNVDVMESVEVNMEVSERVLVRVLTGCVRVEVKNSVEVSVEVKERVLVTVVAGSVTLDITVVGCSRVEVSVLAGWVKVLVRDSVEVTESMDVAVDVIERVSVIVLAGSVTDEIIGVGWSTV